MMLNEHSGGKGGKWHWLASVLMVEIVVDALHDQTFLGSIEVTDVCGERKKLDWERGEKAVIVLNQPIGGSAA